MPIPESKPCIAKIGQPDLSNGMQTCTGRAQWLNAGDQRADGTIAHCTGWTHTDPALNASHGAVPKGWA
jgi:hypothetical protein